MFRILFETSECNKDLCLKAFMILCRNVWFRIMLQDRVLADGRVGLIYGDQTGSLITSGQRLSVGVRVLALLLMLFSSRIDTN